MRLRLLLEGGLDLPCHQDYRRTGSDPLNAMQKSKAVHVRHGDIAQDGIESVNSDRMKAGCGGLCNLHQDMNQMMAHALCQGQEKSGVVIHDQ